ncbi:MAG: hypothetical protein L6R42_004824 [Xanthoria sp. 1 TBL-2021]|nr:MAG: hypothetical protein L6R42_004824 [Xanthoria sp. 1 TBL-2021]
MGGIRSASSIPYDTTPTTPNAHSIGKATSHLASPNSTPSLASTSHLTPPNSTPSHASAPTPTPTTPLTSIPHPQHPLPKIPLPQTPPSPNILIPIPIPIRSQPSRIPPRNPQRLSNTQTPSIHASLPEFTKGGAVMETLAAAVAVASARDVAEGDVFFLGGAVDGAEGAGGGVGV